MTLEEILAALQAIIDQAVSDDGQARDLTEDEAQRYEQLEARLATVRRSEEIRARQQAYATPTRGTPALVPSRGEDTLERAFNHYLRTGTANQDLVELRAQGEGLGSAGGYLVPPGFRDKMVERMVSFGGLAAEVDSFTTTTGAAIEYPSIDDTGNQGTITGESGSFTGGADLAFGKINLGAYKYTSAGASDSPLRVPVELLQDAAFNIEGLITRKLGERIARKQAAHWCTGTGVGEPQGIVCSTLTADRDLDTADTPDYEDLVELQDLLDEAYEPRAVWVMKKGTWSQLRLIVDTIGRPILQTLTEGISGKPERRLLGSRVVIDPGMPTLSSAGDTYPIIYGDLKEAYVTRRVSDIAVVVNPYSRASNGEVEFTAWERADGGIQNRYAYVIMQNNT